MGINVDEKEETDFLILENYRKIFLTDWKRSRDINSMMVKLFNRYQNKAKKLNFFRIDGAIITD